MSGDLLPPLVVKELVDNALDASGSRDYGWLEEDVANGAWGSDFEEAEFSPSARLELSPSACISEVPRAS